MCSKWKQSTRLPTSCRVKSRVDALIHAQRPALCPMQRILGYMLRFVFVGPPWQHGNRSPCEGSHKYPVGYSSIQHPSTPLGTPSASSVFNDTKKPKGGPKARAGERRHPNLRVENDAMGLGGGGDTSDLPTFNEWCEQRRSGPSWGIRLPLSSLPSLPGNWLKGQLKLELPVT